MEWRKSVDSCLISCSFAKGNGHAANCYWKELFRFFTLTLEHQQLQQHRYHHVPFVSDKRNKFQHLLLLHVKMFFLSFCCELMFSKRVATIAMTQISCSCLYLLEICFHFSVFSLVQCLTYCPSSVIGGVTENCWIELVLLTLTIHRWMSGFFEPGVGYRTVRVSGNDVLPKLCTAITAPESNHG